MRELDRIALVGPGRLGTALAAALRAGGLAVDGPLGRDETPAPDATLVVLCVPDAALAAAAAAVSPGPLLAHVSGATTLAVLTAAGHPRALSLHPLMTLPAGAGADALRGAPAAVAGTDDAALAAARALAAAAGLDPIVVADADRAAYHGAASLASNLLVTLEAAAERLGATAGVERARLGPLVRATVENWLATGAAALTGPVARGDRATVEAQRTAVRERTPDLLPLFDALTEATRALAVSRPAAASATRPAPSPTTSPETRAPAESGPDAPSPTGPAPVRDAPSPVEPAPHTPSPTALTPDATVEDETVTRTVAATRARTHAWRARGETIALVPTMGALHAGHAALIERARALADRTIVWIFVNPKQFGESADLAAYPRDEAGDVATARAAGADLVFAPTADEVYPDGFATTVSVGGPSAGYEGAHRPGHFDGVATVVLKMLLMTGPDVAVFGAKDAQQVAVVRRLVRDLDVPVALDVVPTVREAGGLARSSRNVHLSAADRDTALALHRGIAAARDQHAAGEADAAALTATASAVLAAAGIAPDYVAVVDRDSFLPTATVDGNALIAVAARVGGTRLIDNLPLEVPMPDPAPSPAAPGR